MTTLSSVRLPKSVRRVVKPVPAAVTSAEELRRRRSGPVALVVVAEPLFIALLDPTAAAEASSGLTVSTPEYSWM